VGAAEVSDALSPVAIAAGVAPRPVSIVESESGDLAQARASAMTESGNRRYIFVIYVEVQ
jgi:hypothetical protein